MKTRFLILFIAVAAMATLLFAPTVIHAAECGSGDQQVEVSIDVGCDGTSENPIYDYLRGIIIFLGGAIGLAVVITIIVSGIQYSSSNGNPQAIAQAKDRLVNAVIGLVLYLFLAAILRYLVPQIFN